MFPTVLFYVLKRPMKKKKSSLLPRLLEKHRVPRKPDAKPCFIRKNAAQAKTACGQYQKSAAYVYMRYNTLCGSVIQVQKCTTQGTCTTSGRTTLMENTLAKEISNLSITRFFFNYYFGSSCLVCMQLPEPL